MNSSSTDVSAQEYVALHKSQRWRSAHRERLALARKTYVQQLARIGCEYIDNQRKRGEIKAKIYNKLIPMLVMHENEHAATRRYYQKIITVLTGILGITVLFIAFILNYS